MSCYSDTAEGVRIDFKRLVIEGESHGLIGEGMEEFLQDCECFRGEDGLYDAFAALGVLGY